MNVHRINRNQLHLQSNLLISDLPKSTATGAKADNIVIGSMIFSL